MKNIYYFKVSNMKVKSYINFMIKEKTYIVATHNIIYMKFVQTFIKYFSACISFNIFFVCICGELSESFSQTG